MMVMDAHGYTVCVETDYDYDVPITRRMFVLHPDGTRLDLTAEECATIAEAGPAWLDELIATVPDHRWSR
jgi:hypothetical protein